METTTPRKPKAFAAAACIFKAHGGVLRTSEAIRRGVHPRTLYAMHDAGDLERLERGLFRLTSLQPLDHPDLVTVALRAPDGVLCLLSALSVHEITTEIPHEVHLALPRGAEPPRIEHPPVRPFWFSGRAFSEGIETRSLDGFDVRLYGAAKSVADAFKYRNKLGLDVALEALRNYLRTMRGDPEELLRFASICRVERVMRPYLEALL